MAEDVLADQSWGRTTGPVRPTGSGLRRWWWGQVRQYDTEKKGCYMTRHFRHEVGEVPDFRTNKGIRHLRTKIMQLGVRSVHLRSNGVKTPDGGTTEEEHDRLFWQETTGFMSGK